MIEVKFYGRGGQGAVVASVILANAAFKEGKFVQAFPFYGIERRGAPVAAYTRIDTKPIRARGQINNPGIIVVLDPYLIGLVDVTQGLKPASTIILNTEKKASDFNFDKSFKIFTCDATSIAVKYGLGAKTAPIVNTTILGAFAKATGVVKLKSLEKTILEKISLKANENVKATEEAFNSVKV